MRPRRVAAFAFDRDLDVVGRRHHRAGADGEFADRQARIIVHAVDFIDAEAAHQAVLDHRQPAAAALLRRLEDDHGGAGEIACLGQIFGGAEQHRGVAVMAAGMHLARHRRFVRQAGFLLERQRVHVGAQPDDLFAGLAAADDADDAGPADAGYDFVAAKALQKVRHRARRAVHVELQLRMGVNIPPPAGDFLVKVGDTIDDRHRNTSSLTGVSAQEPNLAKTRSLAEKSCKARPQPVRAPRRPGSRVPTAAAARSSRGASAPIYAPASSA